VIPHSLLAVSARKKDVSCSPGLNSLPELLEEEIEGGNSLAPRFRQSVCNTAVTADVKSSGLMAPIKFTRGDPARAAEERRHLLRSRSAPFIAHVIVPLNARASKK
jgi:hypothetical protein